MPRFVLIPPGESPFLKLGIVPGPRAYWESIEGQPLLTDDGGEIVLLDDAISTEIIPIY